MSPDASLNSVRSWPTQNPRPAPVMTTARTSGLRATFSSSSPGEVSDEEALDAYSLAVTTVAERLSPSVANLRVSRRVRGGRIMDGGGSGVVITPDGFTLTSAHVVARTDGRGLASFPDGRELEFEIVGSDPLSDL